MNKRAKWKGMINKGVLYVGVGVHEKESQLAVLERDGSLVMARALPWDKFTPTVLACYRLNHACHGYLPLCYNRPLSASFVGPAPCTRQRSHCLRDVRMF